MKILALIAASTLIAAPAVAQTQTGTKPARPAPRATKVAAPVKTVTAKDAKVKVEHAKREAPSKPRPKR
ncbi:hypothetical protein KV697_13675 [Sphingomonas sanguinis]|uniref:hypothetical protein n=1 Tax=Sphingomonas sanguinis TaxID=33051 RepID=UPI001C55D4B7|nr:hypothetical protein [Sphingomonas sanguinis]QXT34828.1 hypothetical protein KV697_13675 [Sphingomonas sanguinis]